MNNTSKKLALKTESIRVLGSDELTQINGGFPQAPFGGNWWDFFRDAIGLGKPAGSFSGAPSSVSGG